MKLLDFLYLLPFLIGFSLLGQEEPNLVPKIGRSYDFLSQRQVLWSKCDSLAFTGVSNMSAEETRKLSNTCDEIEYS